MSARRGTVAPQLSVAVPLRLDSLNGLRFLAAFLVFFHHLLEVLDFGRLDFVLLSGRVGVSFFYLLSGFVFTWSYQEVSVRTFYRRRAARIYPAHLFVWFLAVGLLVSAGGAVRKSDLLSLLLLQSWIPRMDVYFATNGVAWSLSCEVFFYACFPCLAALLMGASAKHRRWVAGGVLGLQLVLALALHGQTEAGSVGYWLIYIFPFTRLSEFVLGMVLALELREGSLPRIPLAGALVAAGAGFVLAGLGPDSFSFTVFTIVPFSAIIVGASQQDLSGTGGALRRPLLVRLGAWSYSFYLVHQLVIRLAPRLGLVPEGARTSAFQMRSVFVIVVLFAASIAVSAAIYHYWEMPANRALRASRRRGSSREPGGDLLAAPAPGD